MKDVKNDVVPGDIAFADSTILGFVIDNVSIIDDDSKSYKDTMDENAEFLKLSTQREYWKKTRKRDIGNPTRIFKIIHLYGGNKVWYYPDTTVTIIKNKITRKITRKFEREYTKRMNKENKFSRRELRKMPCNRCDKRIQWWQRAVFEPDMCDLVAVHKKCKNGK